MTSLEQRLRERYAEMVEGLSHDERGNLEGSREPLSTHDADDLARPQIQIDALHPAVLRLIAQAVRGARGKMVYATGDADEGIWSAGQVQGLIHDIPSCAELVSRIMREAETIIRSRLEGMMSPAQRQAAE